MNESNKIKIGTLITFFGLINSLAFIGIGYGNSKDNMHYLMLYLSFIFSVLMFPLYYFIIFKNRKPNNNFSKIYYLILLVLNLIIFLIMLGTLIYNIMNR